MRLLTAHHSLYVLPASQNRATPGTTTAGITPGKRATSGVMIVTGVATTTGMTTTAGMTTSTGMTSTMVTNIKATAAPMMMMLMTMAITIMSTMTAMDMKRAFGGYDKPGDHVNDEDGNFFEDEELLKELWSTGD